MPDQMKAPAWHPIYDAHAVEQTAFILQFDKVIDQKDFLAVHNVANVKFTVADFPRRGPMLALPPMITIGVGNNPPIMMPSMGGGFAFQKYQEDGQIDSELRFDGTSIAFRTLKYSRWEKIWGNARRYFNEILPIYAHSTCLASVGLQYTNKFISTSSHNRPGVSNILRKGSTFIAPYIYESEDLWHNHTGAFTRPNNYTKRLLNLNIDRLEEPAEGGEQNNLITRINTVLTDTFNQPGYETVTVTEEKVNDICNTHMEVFHKLNKDVIAQVISDEMIERIDLWAK